MIYLSQSDVHHKNYSNALDQRNAIQKDLRSINDKIVSFKNFQFIEKNIEPYDSVYLERLSEKETFDLLTDKKIRLKDVDLNVKQTESIFKNLNQMISTRNASDYGPLVTFLKENNTSQNSWLKRLLNIPKDPFKISRRDVHLLLPILAKSHLNTLEQFKTQKSNIKQEINVLELSLDHKKNVSKISSKKEQLNLINKTIDKYSLPFKKILENIIDLDFKSLKNNLSQNNINMKSLLVFISELLRSNTPQVINNVEVKPIELKRLETDVKTLALPPHKSKKLAV